MSDMNQNNEGKRTINPILTPQIQQPKTQPQEAPKVEPVEEEVKADDFTSYEDEVEKVQPPIKPIHEEGEEISDDDERQVADNLDDLVNASMSQVDDGEVAVKNLADAGFSLPVSSPEAISQYAEEYVEQNADTVAEQSRDMSSDLQKIYAASIMHTDALSTSLESMQRMKKEGVDPKDQLKRSRKGVGDSPADIFTQYRNDKVINLDGYKALMAMTALSPSGIRRITLWNSGIQVRLRSLPLDLLNAYTREVSSRSYEFGKEFGAVYYRFADLSISEYVIDRLLPAVIVGSNYANWSDMDQLKKVISWQDYNTLLWAMGAMLHPNGLRINFVCANKGCGHVDSVPNADLNKLHLLNVDLINPEMIEHFKLPGAVSDEQLEHYRDICNLKKEITFSYSIDGVEKKWKVGLKQCSVYDYEAVGRDYNGELRKSMNDKQLKNKSIVDTYRSYNDLRIFKPWIEYVELTLSHNNEEKTFVLKNSSTDTNTSKAIYTVLDEWQTYYPQFRKDMHNYILDTQISHIAYYYPKCPKCGQVPDNSYGGYVPYDPQHAFFILSLMRLYKNEAQMREATLATSQG